MRPLALLLLFQLSAFAARAQAAAPDSLAFNVAVPKEIVILRSTRDYSVALAEAKKAAKALGRPLDLGGNHPNKTLGLSMTKADCEGSAYDYPCYTARGEGGAEDSDYLSVEYSDGYQGFAKGYYLVVAALADPQSKKFEREMTRIKRAYPVAYAKRTSVWRGCMH